MIELTDTVKNTFDKIDFTFWLKKYKDSLNIDGVKVEYDFLGKGGDGTVFSIKFIDDNRIYDNYAIKIFKRYEHVCQSISKAISDDVINDVIPNFITIYRTRMIKPYYIILMNKADGDLNNWLTTKHSIEEWQSFLGQIIISVIYLKYKRVCHNDCKPKNILYRKINKPVTLTYNFNDISFKKIECNYIFYIIDFGNAESLDFMKKMSPIEIDLCIKNNCDLYHLTTLDKRIKVSYLMKLFTIHQLKNIINSYNDKRFTSYYKSEKKDIWYKLKQYPLHIKTNMLAKSIAYYIIEKDYFDFNTIPEKIKILKLPPSSIINIMSNLCSSDNLFDIVNKVWLN